jgi:cytochrome d ubiquinol oxidase subunit II
VTLEILWFWLVAVLWAGYFLLEGFDFGVGMLLPSLPRSERERSTMFETIGPVWDGNEVWLVVAGGATFAAFPAGTRRCSRLLPRPAADPRPADRPRRLVRVAREERQPALARGVAWANTVGSVGAPLRLGRRAGQPRARLPLDSDGNFTGNVLDLFSPTRCWRAGHGRALRPARRDVPRAAHDRGAARARRAAARRLACRSRSS